MTEYFTEYGIKIHNPDIYAKTGAPMYKYNSTTTKNINESEEKKKKNTKQCSMFMCIRKR